MIVPLAFLTGILMKTGAGGRKLSKLKSMATNGASLHDAKPKAILSFSAVLRQVFLGLPRFLFPSA